MQKQEFEEKIKRERLSSIVRNGQEKLAILYIS